MHTVTEEQSNAVEPTGEMDASNGFRTYSQNGRHDGKQSNGLEPSHKTQSTVANLSTGVEINGKMHNMAEKRSNGVEYSLEARLESIRSGTRCVDGFLLAIQTATTGGSKQGHNWQRCFSRLAIAFRNNSKA